MKKAKNKIDKITEIRIEEVIDEENKENCQNAIDIHLEKSQKALEDALQNKEFADEIRSRALAFSGEILI